MPNLNLLPSSSNPSVAAAAVAAAAAAAAAAVNSWRLNRRDSIQEEDEEADDGGYCSDEADAEAARQARQADVRQGSADGQMQRAASLSRTSSGGISSNGAGAGHVPAYQQSPPRPVYQSPPRGAMGAGGADVAAVRKQVLREVLGEVLGISGPKLDNYRLDPQVCMALPS